LGQLSLCGGNGPGRYTGAQSVALRGYGSHKSQSAEFFGFFSTSSKFAGIVGPLLFGVVSQVAGGSRLSIVSLVIFFIVGGFLLTRVDEQEGMRAAREEDAAFALSGA
jgi:UMF1 family MFS transporter